MGSDWRDSDPVAEVPRGQSPLLWRSLIAALAEARLVRGADTSVGGAEPTMPRVLDCGGGSGSLAVPLAGLGAAVTVVDVSVDALSTLIRRASEAGVSARVTAVQGEAESLTMLLPGQSFDLVLAHGVLEKVGAVAPVLGEIAAVLSPGGLVSVVVGNPVASVLGRALAGDVAGALSLVREPGESDWDLALLMAGCEAAGLQVEAVEGIGVFTDLVPGIDLERPGVQRALTDLEAAIAGRPPYRDIASRLHLTARRPESTGHGPQR